MLLQRFDLQPQVTALGAQLRPPYPPRGVVILTAGGTIDFFESYVRPRLLYYLEVVANLFDVASPDYVWIDHGDLADQRYVVLGDRLAAMPGDVLFVLVHTSAPAEVMKQAALSFVAHLRQRLDPMLGEQRRLVVLIWLRENGDALDLDSRLPALEPFSDPDWVAGWLGAELKRQGVGDEDRQRCVEYVKCEVQNANGNPRATFLALSKVLDRLQGKRA
jgi:hypothetical protein